MARKCRKGPQFDSKIKDRESIKQGSRDLEITLFPVFEDPESFRQRQEEVAVFLADMVLRARKRGRPKKESGKER